MDCNKANCQSVVMKQRKETITGQTSGKWFGVGERRQREYLNTDYQQVG